MLNLLSFLTLLMRLLYVQSFCTSNFSPTSTKLSFMLHLELLLFEVRNSCYNTLLGQEVRVEAHLLHCSKSSIRSQVQYFHRFFFAFFRECVKCSQEYLSSESECGYSVSFKDFQGCYLHRKVIHQVGIPKALQGTCFILANHDYHFPTNIYEGLALFNQCIVITVLTVCKPCQNMWYKSCNCNIQLLVQYQ